MLATVLVLHNISLIQLSHFALLWLADVQAGTIALPLGGRRLLEREDIPAACVAAEKVVILADEAASPERQQVRADLRPRRLLASSSHLLAANGHQRAAQALISSQMSGASLRACSTKGSTTGRRVSSAIVGCSSGASRSIE